MTIAFSNVTSELTSTNGVSPRSVSITQPTSGNMLVLAVRDSLSLGAVSVTDDQANSYTQIHSFTDSNGDPVQLFRSGNLTGTMPTALSVSWGGGGSRIITVMMAEMSGVDGASPLDFSGTSTTGFGVSEDITFTTANNNEAAFAFVVNLGGGRDYSITEAGFTRTPAGSVQHSSIYKADLGASGSGKTLTITWVADTNADIGLVTFNPAAGGSSSATVAWLRA